MCVLACLCACAHMWVCVRTREPLRARKGEPLWAGDPGVSVCRWLCVSVMAALAL